MLIWSSGGTKNKIAGKHLFIYLSGASKTLLQVYRASGLSTSRLVHSHPHATEIPASLPHIGVIYVTACALLSSHPFTNSQDTCAFECCRTKDRLPTIDALYRITMT